MILYIVLIAVLILHGMKLHLWSFNEDYLTKEGTDAIRGIFILLIFASHFSQGVDPYTAPLDMLYWKIREALGQAVVSCFFFYSGYGIAVSARQKGDKYVRDIPRRRVLPTLLIYDCSQILFLILQRCRGRTYDLKHFVLSFLSWNSFGNDNWYIFVILGLYLITWLVLRGREFNEVTVSRISACSLGFMLFLLCSGKGAFWYNTCLCYPLGMWFCLYKDKIDRFMASPRYYPTIFLTGLAYIGVHKVWNRNLALYVLTMMVFALCVVFLTMKVQIRNPILIYCGKHLQGLFLLHRIPFIALSDFFNKSGTDIYFYFGISIFTTFLLEAIFSKVIVFLKNSSPAKL